MIFQANRKSQSQYIYTYIIVSIVVALLIIFSYKAITSFKEKQREVILTELKEKIKATVDVISTKKGSKEEKTFNVPRGTNEVCFVDLSKREEVLKSPLLNKYMIIKESLLSWSKENMFVIKEGKVEWAEYIGEICLDHYPYYICKETENELLNVLLEGEGKCASVHEEFVAYMIAESGKEYEQVMNTSKAKLAIAPYTEISPLASVQITLEPVYMNVSGVLLSEVYSLTPTGTSFSKPAKITLKFDKDLMPSKTSISNLKVRAFYNYVWNDLVIEDVSYEREEITALIEFLAPVAVFITDAPTAVITEPYNNQLFGINEEISFDGSSSYDPNDDIEVYEWNFGDGSISNEKTTTYKYSEPGYYFVSLKVTDKEGNFGIAEIMLIVKSNNKKDESKYNNPLFIISEEEGWQAMLKVVPISMWNDVERNEYPYLIYHEESPTKEDFLNSLEKYNYNELIVFERVPEEIVGIANEAEDYFSYWEYYEDMVIVSFDNKEDALMASLFASFVNAPLIFVESSNIGSYESNIKDKKVYIIGEVDSSVETVLNNNAKNIVRYTLNDIKNPTINPYVKISAEVMFSSFD